MFSDVMLSVRFVSTPLPFTLFTISLCTFFPLLFLEGCVCVCVLRYHYATASSLLLSSTFVFFFFNHYYCCHFFFVRTFFMSFFWLLLFYFSSQRRQLRQRPNCTCSTHTHTCIHKRAQCLHVHKKKSESNEPSVITHTHTNAHKRLICYYHYLTEVS